MDADNCALARGLVSAAYIDQGAQALGTRRRMVKSLLSSRRLPQRGWDEATILMLLQDCALMDSNTFPGNVGVGEREARIACPLVSRRHFLMAHGVGRSGDIAAEQPKAAGSSLLAKLGAALAGDALRIAGLEGMAPPVVLPLATGMAITMTLLMAAAERGPDARTVVWSRIDQKTCLKAITAANLVPEVVELRSEGDQLVTDVDAIAAAVERVGADRVAAVVTTTSCFAPRAPDDVVSVAKLCARLGVPHIVNNAYGVQSRETCAALTAAARRGRVDAIVQSTDKNFMVPVGGALVVAPATSPDLPAAVAALYPGRASAAPLIDLLATLLHFGADGWAAALAAREALHPRLRAAMAAAAEELGERVLETPGNPISIAMTLDGLLPGPPKGGGGDAAAAAAAGAPAAAPQAAAGGAPVAGSSSSSIAAAEKKKPGRPMDVTFLGSMLFSRGVSGTRVVAPGRPATVAGLRFEHYGAHAAGGYPHAYLTAAAAIGASVAEGEEFCARLVKAYREFQRKARGGGGGGGGVEVAAEASASAAAAAGAGAAGAGAAEA